MLIGMLLVLTACEGSIRSSKAPIIASPGDNLIRPCQRPVSLPDRALTQEEVESYWIRDRANLIACGKQLQSLSEFIKKRDIQITEVSP